MGRATPLGIAAPGRQRRTVTTGRLELAAIFRSLPVVPSGFLDPSCARMALRCMPRDSKSSPSQHTAHIQAASFSWLHQPCIDTPNASRQGTTTGRAETRRQGPSSAGRPTTLLYGAQGVRVVVCSCASKMCRLAVVDYLVCSAKTMSSRSKVNEVPVRLRPSHKFRHSSLSLLYPLPAHDWHTTACTVLRWRLEH